jgi:glycosyltransferase involved in cell wall biosynthesis
MPVFNAARTVAEALRSLLTQTYERLEILVVDDGSVDASMDIVAAVADPRVRVLRHAHEGVVHALNAGCARSRGELIARLDADDVAEERRLAMQVAYLDGHPEVGMVGAWARIEGEGSSQRIFAPPPSDAALRRYLLWDNPFVTSAVMFRRAAFEDAGGYSTGTNEDYRLWIRIARRWKVAVLPEVLVTYRIRTESLSRAMHRPEALLARLRVQVEAARALGPWHLAVPALTAGSAAYLLALLGDGPQRWARWRLGGLSGRLRGIREASTEDRAR